MKIKGLSIDSTTANYNLQQSKVMCSNILWNKTKLEKHISPFQVVYQVSLSLLPFQVVYQGSLSLLFPTGHTYHYIV